VIEPSAAPGGHRLTSGLPRPPVRGVSRLALTGKMSGPDVGEQIRLLHLAEGHAAGLVPLSERITKLKAFLASGALAEKPLEDVVS
jgi:hypothetical protein